MKKDGVNAAVVRQVIHEVRQRREIIAVDPARFEAIAGSAPVAEAVLDRMIERRFAFAAIAGKRRPQIRGAGLSPRGSPSLGLPARGGVLKLGNIIWPAARSCLARLVEILRSLQVEIVELAYAAVARRAGNGVIPSDRNRAVSGRPGHTTQVREGRAAIDRLGQ
jgi:hypothetical protein